MSVAVPSAPPARPVPDEAFLAKARELRPFYFIVVVWGERYVDFLLNFCVASLMAPGNIPALANRGKNKFVIATTDEDWVRMQDRPIFRKLAEYAEPVKVLIPPCPPGVSGCVHMGIGHKLATQMAFEARAYSVLLTPDLMLSDGTMAEVQRHAVDGIQVVLTAALRFGEEPLFKNLDALGLCSIDSRFGDEAKPLAITGRQMVAAGITGMHSETVRYGWESSCFSSFPVACWWRVPGEDGILVHCLSWAPLLIDYDAIEHHDSSMMDNWTIDGDYVYRNFGLKGKVHVEQDSDRIMLVSWAPLADREQSLEPNPHYGIPYIGALAKGLILHDVFFGPSFDPLKRDIFFRAVRWHSKDISTTWVPIERRATSVLANHVSRTQLGHQLARRVYISSATAIRLLRRGLRASIHFAGRVARFLPYYWEGRHRVFGVAVRAMRGERDAVDRIRGHVVYLIRAFFGRTIPRKNPKE